MSALTKHLPVQAYEGSILSALGKGLTLADAHHDLSPDEGEAVMAEIVRRVNLHDELVAALRMAEERLANLSQHTAGIFVGNAASGASAIRHVIAKVEAA